MYAVGALRRVRGRVGVNREHRYEQLTDAKLADSVPWHDKRVLYTLLDQPYLEIPAGRYWIKPAVSEEGLGYQAGPLRAPERMVLVPEAQGPYLNVDAKDGELHVWSGKRDGVRFLWFRYLGQGHRHLTPAQLGIVTKVQRYAPGAWVNVELIGDTVIEAHARRSHELVPMIPLWQQQQRDVYCLPAFVWPLPLLLNPLRVDRLEQPEVAVQGHQREALVYMALDSEGEATALAHTLHPGKES